MKLRNKKTGEIIETHAIFENAFGNIRIRKKGEAVVSYPYEYNSLAELNNDWEDVPEEVKTYFYISTDGYISESSDRDFILATNRKEFGNYFETSEQAKLALDKIKAWQEIKKDLDGELHWQTEGGGGRFSIWGHFISSGLLRDEAILDNHREDLDILLKNREGGEE